MSRRAPLLFLVAVVVAAVAATATPVAQATHWCGLVDVFVSPPFAQRNASTTFQIEATYRGNGTLVLTRVAAIFNWETVERDLGSASIPSGGSRTFPIVGRPIGNGPWSVGVRLVGQAPGDTMDGECTYSQTVGMVSQDFFAGISLIGLLLIVCGIIIIAIVIIVVVVLVLLAKRPPTQPVYPYPPPGAPPWPPPPGPPEQPAEPPKLPGT